MRKFIILIYAAIASGLVFIATGVKALPLTVTLEGKDVCLVTNDSTMNGYLQIIVNGGVTPYNYQCYRTSPPPTTLIQSGTIYIPGISSYEYVLGLIAGTYMVSVTDANSNVATASLNIDLPESGNNLGIQFDMWGIDCSTSPLFGNITVSAFGGTPSSVFPFYTFFYRDNPGDPLIPIPNDSIYMYLGMPTVTFHHLPEGDFYEFVIYDNNDCATGQLFVVDVEPISLYFTNFSPETCVPGDDGEVCLNIQNGTIPFTINWSDGTTQAILTNGISPHTICRYDLSYGTYGVTVTDNYTCNAHTNVSIPHAPSVSSYVNSVTHVTCSSGSDGSIDIVATGGTVPYSYNWSNGSTTQDLVNVPAGTYYVTVTDAEGCTSISSATINQPADITADLSWHNVNCYGENSGTLLVVITGGTPGYSVTFNSIVDNIPPFFFSGIPAGIYTAHIVDAHSCTKDYPITISQPSAPLSITLDSLKNVLCNGNSTGAVYISVYGGTAPFGYVWSNGATTVGTTQDIVNKPAGNYYVTVTDFNNCKTTGFYTISQPADALHLIYNTTNILCYGDSTGSIVTSVWGGVSPYSYLWNNGAVTQNLNNIPAGTYSVVVTDANYCTVSSGNIVITQPSAPLSATLTYNEIPCHNYCTGSVSVTPAGGTSPYVVFFNAYPDFYPPYNYYEICSTLNFIIEVYDANGCYNFYTHDFNQPAYALSIDDADISHVACFGNSLGAIDISVSGGTTPYSYIWSNGTTTIATSQDISNVPAGNYCVTVTDANLCTVTGCYIIDQPGGPLNIYSMVGDVQCNGGTDGYIEVYVTGGTPPYYYLWSNGATTQNLTGIPAGNYTLTVTDQNYCVLVSNVIQVTQPASALWLPIATWNAAKCYGECTGSAEFSPAGGTPPYTLQLLVNGAIKTAPPYFFPGLCAGSETALITDSHGCQNFYPFTITQPSAPLTITLDSLNDVLCWGDYTGAVYITVNGGTLIPTPPPAHYNYVWMKGSDVVATTQDLENVSAGTYCVTVTDKNGCYTTECYTIDQPSYPLYLYPYYINDVLCYGEHTGSIGIEVMGGTMPYQFYWSNGANTQNLYNLAAGTYTLTVVDAHNCSIVYSVTINQPQNPLSMTMTWENIKCKGDATGSILINPSGGTSPYMVVFNMTDYLYYPPYSFNNIAAGTYEILIVDWNYCYLDTIVTFTEPADPLGLSGTVTDVLCHGFSTGGIDITVTGGTAPYFYEWSNGTFTEDLTSVQAGDYCVTVTDNNNCTITGCYYISQPYEGLSMIYSTVDVLCNGQSTGSIDISVWGGTLPYYYLWSNGATTEDLTGIPAGNYTITITDDNDCILISGVIQIIQPNEALWLPIATWNAAKCYGECTGSAEFNPAGGTPPYTLQLLVNGAIKTAPPYFFPGLCAGSETALITDSHGCQNFYPFTITQPSAPVTITLDSLNDVLCWGDYTGAVYITVTGGTLIPTPPPAHYNYVWMKGSEVVTTTQDLVFVSAGTYCVTVTDKNGCYATECYTIDQPSYPLYLYPYYINDVLCYGEHTGSIGIEVMGGTMPYQFYWSNGANTQNLYNLAAGTYTLTVVDAHNCSIVYSVTINQPQNPLSMTMTWENIKCKGDATGSIEIIPDGGTGPYVVVFSGLDLYYPPYYFSGITAGTYDIIIIDYNYCFLDTTVTFTEPSDPLGLSGTVTDVLCHGFSTGEVDITVTGGTAPYFYEWSNGTFTEDLTSVQAGDYCVTVTDNNNCTITGCYYISQPYEGLSMMYSTVDVLCNGQSTGSIDISVWGGTLPYYYLWSNGATTEDLTGIPAGNYTITITDDNDCILISGVIQIIQPNEALWLPIATWNAVKCHGECTGSAEFSPAGGTPPYTIELLVNGTIKYAPPYFFPGLCAGTETALITDSHGCQNFYPFTITQPSQPLNLTGDVTHVACHGLPTGIVNITASYGTPPYTYLWDNGATTEDLNGVFAGSYCVVVTDYNNCTISGCFMVEQPFYPLYMTFDKQDVLCHGNLTGSIDITVTGGTYPYFYQWSNNATTEDLTGIAAGFYFVTITDSHGCQFINMVSIIINQPAEDLTGSLSWNNVMCYGLCTGTIDVIPHGGTAPYQVIFNGIPDMVPPFFFAGICAGSYDVIIIDYNNCSTYYPVTFLQPPAPLEVTLDVHDLVCMDGNEGWINALPSGGTPPYSYSWSNGEHTQLIDSLEYGDYCVTVTDANGCTAIECGFVDQPVNPLAALYITGENVSCYGANDGWFEVLATGGAAPYQYSLDYQPYIPSPWDFTYNPVIYSGLTPGFHLLTIGDSNHCEVLYEIEITEPDPLIVTFTVENVLCYGNSTGSIEMSISGGTCAMPVPNICSYTINWSNGATDEDLSNLPAGIYEVTVTDLHDCATIAIIEITQPLAPLSIITDSTHNISCYGSSDGYIYITVLGGTPPYSYVWNPNIAPTEDLTSLSEGAIYCVTVTDANGCTATAQFLITEPSPTVVVMSSTDIMCPGELDGSVTVTVVSGLTAPLTYYWSNGVVTYDPVHYLHNIGAGFYCVTIVDAHGCQGYGCDDVQSPNSPLSMQFDVSDVLCYGGYTGSIVIHPMGGTMPYYELSWYGIHISGCCDTTVVIQGGTGVICCGNYLTSYTLDSLPTGYYYITLTDAYMCQTVDTVHVGGPECPLVISNYLVTDIDLAPSGPIPGAVNIFVCCGTFPYTYWWENQDGDWVSSSEDLYNVPAGTYYVTVTDANGCTVTGSFTVISNAFPNWTYYNSGENHTIYIPSSAVSSSIDVGDYIGVFYDNSGVPTCGGFIKWLGNTTTLAAWGDDPYNPNKTGFAYHEIFQWRIWKAINSTEYAANVSYNLAFPQDSLYVDNGLSGLTSLAPYSMINTQNISLKINWNLISTYINPFYPDIADVVSTISSYFIIAKDELGQVYWPMAFVNQIGDLTIGEAYRVKVSAACTLVVTGVEVIPQITPVSIPSGWSFIGYLRKSPASIVTLMSPIVSNIIIVKNGDGFVYWPSLSVNSIGNMVPGQGYQIKMTTGVTYYYPSNGPLMTDKSFYYYTPKYFVSHEFTGTNMTLGIPNSSWFKAPEPGDEIGIFNDDGLLVGSSVYDGNNIAVAIYGDDELTGNIEGMIINGKFNIRLWHQKANYEEIIVVDEWLQGNDLFTENAISIAGKLRVDESSLGYALYQNTPNPFSGTTFIKFSIPEDAHVTVGLYNLTGELIQVITSSDFNAGIHNIEFNAKEYASGSYMYKFETDNYTNTKQLNIIK